MESGEEGKSMGTGMDGNSPVSEEHFRVNDVTFEVLYPFKNDVSRAGLHELLVFHQCTGGYEGDVALEGSINFISTVGQVDCYCDAMFDRDRDKGRVLARIVL